MTIVIIFKIAAVGIIVTILSQVLEYSGREENAFMVTLAGLLIIMSWVLPYIQELFSMIEELFSLL
jgi:stage III sporulation protein AC